MPRGGRRAGAVVQEEIFSGERWYAGIQSNPARKKFTGCQRRRGRAVLWIPGASAGAEMQQPVARTCAEQQSRASVEVAKFQPKFGTGKFRIHRLVRIK